MVCRIALPENGQSVSAGIDMTIYEIALCDFVYHYLLNLAYAHHYNEYLYLCVHDHGL